MKVLHKCRGLQILWNKMFFCSIIWFTNSESYRKHNICQNNCNMIFFSARLATNNILVCSFSRLMPRLDFQVDAMPRLLLLWDNWLKLLGIQRTASSNFYKGSFWTNQSFPEAKQTPPCCLLTSGFLCWQMKRLTSQSSSSEINKLSKHTSAFCITVRVAVQRHKTRKKKDTNDITVEKA